MEQAGLVQYAMQLLANGSAEDWRRAKNDSEKLAGVIFDLVDADSSGTVDKQELFAALKHGRISVPNGVIYELFEVLDVNGDGVISEEEWNDNFVAYVNMLIKAGSERTEPVVVTPNRLLVNTSPPDSSPATSPSSSPTGGTLPPLPSRGKSANSPTSFVPGPQPLGRARKPLNPFSKSDAAARATYVRLSQSEKRVSSRGQHWGTIRRTLSRDDLSGLSETPASSTGGADLNRRRVTAGALSLDSLSVASSRRSSAAAASKQSDRSVVAPSLRKQYVMAEGHRALNWRSQHSVFEGELVRAETIKTLWDIFQDIDLDSNGTISRRKLEMFLKRKSPAVVPHAQAVFHACTLRKGTSHDGKEDVLDFPSLLHALYPAANSKDISGLLSFLKTQQRASGDGKAAEKLNKLLIEAREQFSIYNTSNDGALTRQQFADGMISFGVPEDERETQLEELFEDQPLSAFVGFDVFFKWYSSMDSLPAGIPVM